MNFIYISPHFPENNKYFCDRLHRNGVNVLGIGDTPYDELDEDLRECLTEYYRVDSMVDYDQVYRAVAFFIFKYGRIDWVESNNEHWLKPDAMIRTDFNIGTGVQVSEVEHLRRKSEMKAFFEKAGIPTARQTLVTNIFAAKAFIEEVGYPVIIKPDIGLGARHTWKLMNDADLEKFFEIPPKRKYVMEEYVDGEIRSYDAIVDSQGDPLFESKTVWLCNSIDAVNEGRDMAFYVDANVSEKQKKVGRDTVKAFGVKSRFVHLEFFRLTQDKPGLGKAGDYVALEVNMRPAGGYMPDMMNYAHSTDVFQIWADMITIDSRVLTDPRRDQYCVYAGRRDGVSYVHSREEIMKKFGGRIVMNRRVTETYRAVMGDEMFVARVPEISDVKEFIAFVQERA